ncbi:hypothetical protein CKU38_01440 [Xanthomonas citri pv. fuscans]|nr:hypothetical protein CKU38_01440 [Xanthomonas citri pv. fuscans]
MHLLLARSTLENVSGGRCRVYAEGLSEPAGKVLPVGSEHPLRSIRCSVMVRRPQLDLCPAQSRIRVQRFAPSTTAREILEHFPGFQATPAQMMQQHAAHAAPQAGHVVRVRHDVLAQRQQRRTSDGFAAILS